ncbi:MAG TPA: iron ABC transporter permease [Oligoflexus sp.]|uniref:FecCD family ABC transporter permease n=1 Tax=Oligoflexus sp. TaxID=1971216 RepID=UPI002D3912BE|nr:iron ABC transporter permease [Oligoflexus sp.]HYX35482.1 iron ABC transporter permease [Oligoflexus sp.]
MKPSVRYTVTLLAGFVLALVLVVASIKMGAVSIPWENFSHLEPAQAMIIWDLRLPRAAMAFLVGGILALTGVCLQGLLRNPLASPSLLGMTSGAALFAAIIIIAQHSFLSFLHPAWAESMIAAGAFVGCLLTSLWLYGLARQSGQTNTALLLLAGVAITSLAGAGTGFITFIADDAQLRSITFWNMGSVGTATWSQVLCIAVFSLPAILILPWMGRSLNAMLLGEQEAQFLGFPVEKQKRLILVCVSLAVGASVAFTGVIGFVGLVVPHLLRLWLGADHQRLLPTSLIFGGCLLLASDIIARTVAAPLELPLGVVTASIGAPYFLYLLQRSARRMNP